MKTTKERLIQIIKEELEKVFKEGNYGNVIRPGDPENPFVTGGNKYVVARRLDSGIWIVKGTVDHLNKANYHHEELTDAEFTKKFGNGKAKLVDTWEDVPNELSIKRKKEYKKYYGYTDD